MLTEERHTSQRTPLFISAGRPTFRVFNSPYTQLSMHLTLLLSQIASAGCLDPKRTSELFVQTLYLNNKTTNRARLADHAKQHQGLLAGGNDSSVDTLDINGLSTLLLVEYSGQEVVLNSGSISMSADSGFSTEPPSLPLLPPPPSFCPAP